MLERKVGANGVVYYASPLLESLGVRHAFSTRLGGVSPPPFDSLNLGNPNGIACQDDYDRIWTNYARLTTSIGAPDDRPLRVHQVHGREVAVVNRGEEFDPSRKADALVSGDGDRVISVRVADCVPVLISSAHGRIVAAVHAGWRGMVAGVIPAAIRRMLAEAAGTRAETFVAAIGPCIGMQAFEVGPEVLAEFAKVFGPAAPIDRTDSGKGHVDLRAAAKLQLIACGLTDDAIDTTDRCNATHGDEFFSHRRDQVVTGRMAALILPRGL